MQQFYTFTMDDDRKIAVRVSAVTYISARFPMHTGSYIGLGGNDPDPLKVRETFAHVYDQLTDAINRQEDPCLKAGRHVCGPDAETLRRG